VTVVLPEARFFVLDVWLEDFFDVDLPDLEIDLLAVFTRVLVGVREVVLAGRLPSPRSDAEAIANIRGAGFLAGIVARICLMAVVCSSSVIRNSWWPSLLATKYRYGTFAGFAAAARLATPGDATGPGGRPLCM
jgi:hypothetical protein